jgi:hypothetical protein
MNVISSSVCENYLEHHTFIYGPSLPFTRIYYRHCSVCLIFGYIPYGTGFDDASTHLFCICSDL